MKRTLMFRAAASALLLSLACTPDDIAQEGTASPEPGADPPSEPGPDPDPDDPDPDDDPDLPLPSDERPGSPGAPCLLDADCGIGHLLRAADLRRRLS